MPARRRDGKRDGHTNDYSTRETRYATLAVIIHSTRSPGTEITYASSSVRVARATRSGGTRGSRANPETSRCLLASGTVRPVRRTRSAQRPNPTTSASALNVLRKNAFLLSHFVPLCLPSDEWTPSSTFLWHPGSRRKTLPRRRDPNAS